MASRISISPTDQDIFNVVVLAGNILLVWNNEIFGLTKDEASRLAGLLQGCIPLAQ